MSGSPSTIRISRRMPPDVRSERILLRADKVIE
jgi:hypothetical protein